jgi:DNA-binding CsgD family transcriptional regulator
MRRRMRRSSESERDDGVAGLWRELRRGDWPIIDGYVFEGRSFVVARRSPSAAGRWDELTARERQVVALAAAGYSNKVIACELGVATSTVGVHLGNARQKLGAKTRAALIGACLGARAGEPSNG